MTSEMKQAGYALLFVVGVSVVLGVLKVAGALGLAWVWVLAPIWGLYLLSTVVGYAVVIKKYFAYGYWK